MSNKATGIVWESDLPRPEKYVLLALADHAKEDGSDVYPSLWRIEWKTGYSETQVREIMAALRAKKILVLVHQGGRFDGDTNKYKIDYRAISMLRDFKEWSAGKRSAERKRKSPETIPPAGAKTVPSPEGAVSGEGGCGNTPNEGTETAPKPSTSSNQNHLEVGNEASSLPDNLPLPINLPPVELEPIKAKAKPQDPRFAEVCDAIRKCWPKGEAFKCDITAADAGAINRMLATKHDWKAEELALCIVARFMSGSINPTESPKAWIGAVTDYQGGPLDKFGVPMFTDSALNRWRNQARVTLYGPTPEQMHLKQGAESEDHALTIYISSVDGKVSETGRQLFHSFKEYLRQQLDAATFTKWIRPLQFCCVTATELHLRGPRAEFNALSEQLETEIKSWLPKGFKGVRFMSTETVERMSDCNVCLMFDGDYAEFFHSKEVAARKDYDN